MSYISPLGSALFGKSAGESSSFTVGGNTRHIRVLEVTAPDFAPAADLAVEQPLDAAAPNRDETPGLSR
ncbi:MAG: GreA/GreB family elongation factor [Bacteroidota bacterium]